LPGQDTSASGLKIEEWGARSATRGRCLRDLLEEFAGPTILALIEGEVRFLQNGWDILCQRFTNVTAERAAH
jgi:hypothetical protein